MYRAIHIQNRVGAYLLFNYVLLHFLTKKTGCYSTPPALQLNYAEDDTFVFAALCLAASFIYSCVPYVFSSLESTLSTS